MPADTAAVEDSPSSTKMRILPRYENYCPDCNGGRTKIAGRDAAFNDRVPCPTCRPEDNKAELRRREKEAKQK